MSDSERVLIFAGPRNRGPNGRFATIAESDLKLDFGQKSRNAGPPRDTPIGPIQRVEYAGPDKTVLTASMRDARSAAGARGLGWSVWIRLGRDAIRDRVRVMRSQDVKALDELDAEIDKAALELKRLRDKRATLVAKAWRAGTGPNPDQLRERAEERLAARSS